MPSDMLLFLSRRFYCNKDIRFFPYHTHFVEFAVADVIFQSVDVHACFETGHIELGI